MRSSIVTRAFDAGRVWRRTVFGVLLAGALAGCTASGAKDPFAEGMGRDPTPRTLHMMSRLLDEQGKYAQAEYVLTRVIDESPSYMPAYIELAELMQRQGRLEEAASVLERAAGHAPRDPVPRNNLGVIRLEQQRFGAAAESFAAAREADPREARYLSNHALALALAGREDDAIALFTAASSRAEALWNMGVIYESGRHYEKAAAAFRRAHERDKTLGAMAEARRVAGLVTAAVETRSD